MNAPSIIMLAAGPGSSFRQTGGSGNKLLTPPASCCWNSRWHMRRYAGYRCLWLRSLPTVELVVARQSQSKPLLASLHESLVEKRTTLSKKSRLGEAFAYALNQWDALCNYCDDGLAEPDNNAAERALRAVCLGKKNYIFFGSDHGGERGALLYGLIGTCRLNGIDPEAYLRHILSVLPEWPSNKVAELLPWNVELTNK